jgi:heme-degrading monooxygenase HmoA
MNDDQQSGRPTTARFARTSLWAGDAETLDRWAAHVTAAVAPMVRALPGNVGATFLIDREAGRALTLTLWDSAEAAERSDANAERSRASTTNATGVELVERGRFQVAGGI